MWLVTSWMRWVVLWVLNAASRPADSMLLRTRLLGVWDSGERRSLREIEVSLKHPSQ